MNSQYQQDYNGQYQYGYNPQYQSANTPQYQHAYVAQEPYHQPPHQPAFNPEYQQALQQPAFTVPQADGSSFQYAPLPQSLSQISGLVVRQKAQKLEAVAQAMGVPYEATNEYRVSALPSGKCVKSEPNDPNGWEPTGDELEEVDAKCKKIVLPPPLAIAMDEYHS